MEKLKWIIISLIIIITLIIIKLSLSAENIDVTSLGSFIILSLTLLALIFYAYDTNLIAKMTKLRWDKENLISATYSMEMQSETTESDKVLFQIMNPSTSIIKAKVNCNFKVYGKDIEFADAYSGKSIWVVFPQQLSQGWFKISDLVKLQEKTIFEMKNEYGANTRSKQLTMNLEIEFRDEFGQRRILPKRKHFFDFNTMTWIPELTTSENWDD